ncbi:MAG: hypothetical protein V4510_07405 [bacterium]
MAKLSAWAKPDTARTVKGLPHLQKTPKASNPADAAMQAAVIKILHDTTVALQAALDPGNASLALKLANYAGGPYHIGITAAGVADVGTAADRRKLVLYVCHNGMRPASAPAPTPVLGVDIQL